MKTSKLRQGKEEMLWGQQRWGTGGHKILAQGNVAERAPVPHRLNPHLSLLQKEQPAQGVVYSSSAWQGAKLP